MGEWKQALTLSGDAWDKFQTAETKHKNQLYSDANVLVQDAMTMFKSRYDLELSMSNMCLA